MMITSFNFTQPISKFMKNANAMNSLHKPIDLTEAQIQGMRLEHPIL